jgi:hypothetical protein
VNGTSKCRKTSQLFCLVRCGHTLVHPVGSEGDWAKAFVGLKLLTGYKDMGEFVQSLEKPRCASECLLGTEAAASRHARTCVLIAA